MASIETRTITTNSFEARVIDLPTGYAKMLYWYLDGNSIFTTGVIPAKSESSWEEITELDSGTPLAPGTTYILKIEIKNLNGEKVDEVQRKITTKSESSSSTRPDKFRWKDGTKEKQSGKPFDITAEEWGNLLDNINAVREYKGYSKIKSTTVPDQGITKFYYPEPNDPFYATNYNQCLYAFHKDIELLTMSEYAEYAVQPEDPITADAINFLVETINSVK